MNNKYYCVSGVVKINDKILFVRHTYGTAKNRILIPGCFVKEKEMPEVAVEREIFEETGVTAKATSILSIQFKPEQWCIIFLMDYVKGKPHSDNSENSEVLLLTPEEAIQRDDITNLSRKIMQTLIEQNFTLLRKSDYFAQTSKPNEYSIFGIL